MFINHVLQFKYQAIHLKVNVDNEMMTKIFFKQEVHEFSSQNPLNNTTQIKKMQFSSVP